jgi:hypothetical protein
MLPVDGGNIPDLRERGIFRRDDNNAAKDLCSYNLSIQAGNTSYAAGEGVGQYIAP